MSIKLTISKVLKFMIQIFGYKLICSWAINSFCLSPICHINCPAHVCLYGTHYLKNYYTHFDKT